MVMVHGDYRSAVLPRRCSLVDLLCFTISGSKLWLWCIRVCTVAGFCLAVVVWWTRFVYVLAAVNCGYGARGCMYRTRSVFLFIMLESVDDIDRRTYTLPTPANG